MFSRSVSALALLAAASCAAAPEDRLSILDLPELPPSAYAEGEESVSPEKLREDLTALYEGLQAAHYDLYARQEKDAYDALYAELMAGLDEPMKPSEAVFVFQRFAAFGNVAHSRLDGSYEVYKRYREAGGKVFALYPRVRDGRLFVSESYLPELRAGDEILGIGGKSTEEWLPLLYRNDSADSDYIHSSLLERSFPFNLWTETGAVESLPFKVRRQDGDVETVTVEAIDADTQEARADIAAADFFVPDGEGRKARIMEGGIAYLQPGPFYSVETPENPWDTAAFWRFIDESFEMFLEEDAKALLIDMRQNPGGDNSFSDRMIAWFADEPFRFASDFLIRSSAQSEASNQARIDLNPASAEGPSGEFAKSYASTPYGETFSFAIPFSRPREGAQFEGPVYALVDRYSYSNTVSVAALLKDYGMATILGEETADLPTSYGAMETFTLPNTGLVVGYPKALIVRPSGDMSDRGVVPDVAIESPLFAESDVVLGKAAEIVRRDLRD